jgi:hypothetical protein
MKYVTEKEDKALHLAHRDSAHLIRRGRLVTREQKEGHKETIGDETMIDEGRRG